MRPAAFLVCALVLAGCASAPAPEGWAFTMTAAEGAAQPLEGAGTFADARELAAPAGAMSLTGAWSGPLAPGEAIRLEFNASAPMRVEFRARDSGGASTSGTCNWPADSTEEKPVGIARVLMRATNTTCSMRVTPTIAITSETPTFEWVARLRDPAHGAWTLQVDASRDQRTT